MFGYLVFEPMAKTGFVVEIYCMEHNEMNLVWLIELNMFEAI